MPFLIGPWELGLILLILLVYFVPTIIAVVRDVKPKLGIIILNILAGWSVIVWVIALVWAIRANKDLRS